MGEKNEIYVNEKFSFTANSHGNSLTILPIGVLDEDVNFTPILDAIGKTGDALESIHFDLNQVTQMNSCGIRGWLLFMERIHLIKFYDFSKVNVLFVEQANLVPKLFGRKGAKVISFEIPYFCSKCDQTTNLLFETEKLKKNDGHFVAPESKCQKCSTTMEFDSFGEDEYFSFLLSR